MTESIGRSGSLVGNDLDAVHRYRNMILDEYPITVILR